MIYHIYWLVCNIVTWDLHKTVYTYNKLLKLVVIQPYLDIKKKHLFIRFEGSCTWNTGIGKFLCLKTTPPRKTPPTIFFFHTTNILIFGVITYTIQIASPLPYLFFKHPFLFTCSRYESLLRQHRSIRILWFGLPMYFLSGVHTTGFPVTSLQPFVSAWRMFFSFCCKAGWMDFFKESLYAFISGVLCQLKCIGSAFLLWLLLKPLRYVCPSPLGNWSSAERSKCSGWRKVLFSLSTSRTLCVWFLEVSLCVGVVFSERNLIGSSWDPCT